MKRKSFSILLALCLLLSAFGGEKIKAEAEAASLSQIAGASSGPAPADPVSAAAAFDRTPSADKPADDAPETPTDPSIPGVWTLFRQKDICLSLVVSQASGLSMPHYYLCLENFDWEGHVFIVDDIVLNDSLVVDQRFEYYRRASAAGLPQIRELSLGQLFSLGALRSGEDLRLRCRVQVSNSQGSPLEAQCEVLVPADFAPGPVFLPFMGALAEEQLLLDNEQLRVTLLGLGFSPEEYVEKLCCQLRVENRSGETLPFLIKGMAVNGSFFEASSPLVNLSPGTLSFPCVSLSSSTLEDRGIDSIGELSLWLRAGEAAQGGAFIDSPGSWYPVVLSRSGQAGGEPSYERILYEDDLVRIAFSGADSFSYDGKTTYCCRLIVWNFSDLDLYLVSRSEPWLFCKVGAGYWTQCTVFRTVPDGTPCPEAPLFFDIMTEGGGAILVANLGPVLLPAE